jgi:hypothetical protein
MIVPEISIVVANWNGEKFLREGLASLWESAVAAGRPFELIVVDDASSDGSVSLIQRKFPQARLLVNSENQRFARASNRGAREAQGRILVMVNNDVIASPDFVSRVTAPFYEPPDPRHPLFAVGAKTVDWENGAPNHLCMTPAWRRGGIGKEWSDPEGRCEPAYVQGGAAAYDRAMFLQLGGFDPLYSPGYWEDYDLSYRAAKAGWRTLYEPAAVARHLGKGSLIRLLGASRLEQLDERNRLWFVWLNLDDPLLWCRHLLAIPWVYARDLATGKGTNGLMGFLRAAGGIARVWRARRHRHRTDPVTRRTDREILRKMMNDE